MGGQRNTSVGNIVQRWRDHVVCQKAGVIYSGRKAQEHGTGRTDFTPAQRLMMPTLGHLDSKPSSKSNMIRGRNSATSADEQPHIGNYRLLK
ncbi:microtubule affinity regulating kinase 2, partial [Homo sapiens]